MTKKGREKLDGRSGMERMIRDRIFQLMGLRLISERILIFVFSLRRRECSSLMIGVSLRRREKRQDRIDHTMVEVIDRLWKGTRVTNTNAQKPPLECPFDITKREQSLDGDQVVQVPPADKHLVIYRSVCCFSIAFGFEDSFGGCGRS